MTTVRRALIVACFGVPAVTLAGAYAWLAMHHGTPLLWNIIVHESGRYTLGQTMLYFSHFLREVPVVFAYALFLLGSSGSVQRRSDTAPPRAIAGTAAALLIIGAFAYTVARLGWETALLDLLQFHTRDDVAGYGTHWNYHWLSTLWFGAAAGLAPTVARRLTRAARGRRVAGEIGPVARHDAPAMALHPRWAVAAWGYFFALTLVFGPSLDIVADIRYVGHQAREILTHAPLTLLLGLGLLLLSALRQPATTTASPAPTWFTTSCALIVLLVPPALAALALRGDVMQHGQVEHGLAAMLAAHVFEHVLDYCLALLLLLAGLSRGSRNRALPVYDSTAPEHVRHAHH